MVQTKTEVCNIALGNLGAAEIQNFDREVTTEAKSCRRYYEVTKDNLLRWARWPFTTKFAELNVVEEDPTEEWDFSYRYPPDCLELRRLVSGVVPDTEASRVPYMIGSDAQGQLIYTDKEDAQCEYTVKQDDNSVVRWPADFVMTLAWLLSWFMAPKVTKGDPFKLRADCAKSFEVFFKKSSATAINEEQGRLPADSEFINARS